MVEQILLRQICCMFLYMLAGIYLYKKKYITKQGSKELGAMLLRIVIPCVIIKSYMTTYSIQKAEELCIAFVLSLLSLVLAMIVSYIIYGKRYGIENFSASFSNAGFIGIPLAQAVYGEEAVFYIASYVALLNLFQWTYGVYLLTQNKKKIGVKAVVSNPIVIALIIGLVLFFLPVTIPEIVKTAMSGIAGLNSPLAMIILGVYIAQMNPVNIFTNIRIYLCALLRLIVLPVLTWLLFLILPIENEMIKNVVVMAAATPVGANVAIFAQQYDKDYLLSVQCVCLTTILSFISIPLLFMIV